MNATPSSSPNAVDRESPAWKRRLLRAMVGKTLAFLAERETMQIKLVRDHLLDIADGKLSLAQAQNVRSAAVILDRRGEAFKRAFQDAMQAALDEELAIALPETDRPGFRRIATVDELDGMSLSLIDVSEVDRILLLDRVSQRFNTHYETSLLPLTQRIGVLLGQEEQSISNNPFRPQVLVRAFMSAWEKGGFDDQATEDLINSLEPEHCIDLAPLHADLLATMTHAGIAAQTGHRIRKSVGGSAFAPLGSSSNFAPLGDSEPALSQRAPLERSPAEAPRSAWGALAPAGRSIASHARQFLQRLGLGSQQGELTSSRMGLSDTSEHPVFEAADPQLMGYLGDLQAGAGASSGYQYLEGQDLSNQNVLRQMRDREEIRRAPELDRGTVDALAEVFDFVFADQAIPMQMKVVIGRLQIPVLKAAMIDRDFFLSADHPARKLVDTLASASIAWAPEKGEDDPLYMRIESTVKRVLNEFEDDLALFSELLLEFSEFLFETEQQAEQQIEPAATQERDKESLDAALAHADEVVHARITALPATLPLAPFLTPFLTTQWREVIAHAWLDAETRPGHWEAALATMDLLVWSTQPKTHSDERKKLVGVLPDLVRSINAGLDSINWTGDERATFTRRLIATHMLAIRMNQPAPEDSKAAALEASASQEAIDALDQRRAGKLAGQADQFDAMAQSLTRGTWFDVVQDDGGSHRCRLSWVSPMRTRLLFTNRDGFDAFVRSEREVAALLRQGRLNMIDQVPIVSRAIDKLMAGDSEPEVVLVV
ncbi:MAG: DUF1631 domain-containing protein [Rhodoferax sp.]|nr:DUF1631 domain-containing protein [Rhodoferax sp.]